MRKKKKTPPVSIRNCMVVVNCWRSMHMSFKSACLFFAPESSRCLFWLLKSNLIDRAFSGLLDMLVVFCLYLQFLPNCSIPLIGYRTNIDSPFDIRSTDGFNNRTSGPEGGVFQCLTSLNIEFSQGSILLWTAQQRKYVVFQLSLKDYTFTLIWEWCIIR